MTSSEPRARLPRFVPRVAWALLFALPIAALLGELVLVVGRRSAQSSAAAFEKNHSDAFEALPARQAADRSLWLVRWRKYRPGAHLEITVAGEPYRVQINERGFRTHPFEVPKPRGLVRIVCLGGSTTVQGRTNDETYPALLEKRLQAATSVPLEVLNLGVSGTYADHWLEDAPELFSYEPDIVLQYEGVNDIMWKALPHYARTHPFRGAMASSLLLERLFPLSDGELDPDLGRIVADEARLAELCAARGVVHIAGSFASPDEGAAPRETRDFLDVDVSRWTSDRGALRLWRYTEYARIVARYNLLLEEAFRRTPQRVVPVADDLRDPRLFVDLCHMTPDGIDRLAASFYPRVRGVLEARR